MVHGVLLAQVGSDLAICKDFREKLLNVNPDPAVHNSLVLPNLKTPNQLGELFRCFRHFGHPTVYEVGAARAQKERTRKPIAPKAQTMRQVEGALVRMIVIQWISKHAVWPSCSIKLDHRPSAAFLSLCARKPLAWAEYERRVSLEDWACLEFSKGLLTFDDFTELLNDNSISPYTSRYSVFSPEMIQEIEGGPPDRPNRRHLKEILDIPIFDFKSIRELIQAGMPMVTWLIVGLHAKERELKEKAGLFSILVLEMRTYFSVTEKNLAQKVLKYISGQTMTLSEAALMGRMYEATKPQPGSNFVRIIMSLDFDKFNQSWTYDSTLSFFTMFDRMFSTLLRGEPELPGPFNETRR